MNRPVHNGIWNTFLLCWYPVVFCLCSGMWSLLERVQVSSWCWHLYLWKKCAQPTSFSTAHFQTCCCVLIFLHPFTFSTNWAAFTVLSGWPQTWTAALRREPSFAQAFASEVHLTESCCRLFLRCLSRPVGRVAVGCGSTSLHRWSVCPCRACLHSQPLLSPASDILRA